MENHNKSFEPMDVDLSVNSSGLMDLSSIDIDKEKRAVEITQVTNMKKFHIKIQRTQSSVWSRIYNIHIASLIIVAIAILTYNIENKQCINELQFHKVRETLLTKIYGQDEAIQLLSEAFEANHKTKILFLYGGTGVGKTYSISLIMQDKWEALNVYHHTTSSFIKTFTTELYFGLTLCKSSIFIIDDLSTNDLNVKNAISDIVYKSDKLDNSVLIVLIFNCDSLGTEFTRKCDNSFLTDLDLHFSDIKAYKRFIPFQALKKEHLLKCVETELGKQKNNLVDYNQFLKNFEVEQDGCKGVHTKMKLFKI